MPSQARLHHQYKPGAFVQRRETYIVRRHARFIVLPSAGLTAAKRHLPNASVLLAMANSMRSFNEAKPPLIFMAYIHGSIKYADMAV